MTDVPTLVFYHLYDWIHVEIRSECHYCTYDGQLHQRP